MYLATQLLSSTVAKIIPEIFEDQEEAARVIKAIDDGFDVLNSRRRYADKPLRCGLGVNWKQQEAALRRLEELLLTARFGNRRSLLPFQQGFVMSIRSTLALYGEMKQEDGFQFLLTALLNQDALESFFSAVRIKFGANANPTPTELLYRVRLLLIGVSPAASRQAPVRLDSVPEEPFLSAARPVPSKAAEETGGLVVPTVADYDTVTVSGTSMVSSADLESAGPAPAPVVPDELLEEIGVPAAGAETERSSISEFGLQYSAGFIASKRAKVDPTLGTRTSELGEDVPDGARWIQLLSRGNLTVPSDEWMLTFKEFEVVFCSLHNGQGVPRRNGTIDNISRAPGVVTKLVDVLQLKWPRLDVRIITLYARLRTFIRLRHVAGIRRSDHIQALADAAFRRAQKQGAPPKAPVVATKRRFVKAKQLARGASCL